MIIYENLRNMWHSQIGSINRHFFSMVMVKGELASCELNHEVRRLNENFQIVIYVQSLLDYFIVSRDSFTAPHIEPVAQSEFS